MSHATAARKSRKDFPLTKRSDGRFQKKVRGRVYYFTGTKEQALAEWLRVKDDLYAGHEPRERTGAMTLRDLLNHFLTVKEQKVQTGELAPRTFNDYKRICDEIKSVLGLTRTLDSLRADDFAKLRCHLAAGRRLVTLKHRVGLAKCVFRYAETEGLVERNIAGLRSQSFKKPSRADLRKERNAQRQKYGAKMFTPAEIMMLVENAKPTMRAMILLATCCGMGNKDLSNLRTEHIRGRWLDYPRPKTGIARRAWLWQECMDAIQEAGGLPFTRANGKPWVSETTSNDAICRQFRNLAIHHGIDRKYIKFYALRHGFETVAGDCKDVPATNLVMGHESPEMASVYREEISDERLIAISNHVHAWLFGHQMSNRFDI